MLTNKVTADVVSRFMERGSELREPRGHLATGLLCRAGAVGLVGGAATGSQPVLGCDTRD
jgi:hypothetical protein